jgi:hypothetical protein
MDTKTILAESKARFDHNAAKAYLKEKYDGKFLVAEQGGLWRAEPNIISFLNSGKSKTVILRDTFDNPVKVDRKTLATKLQDTYDDVMQQWYDEWQDLENKR